jgi:hypothetical protein
MNARLGFCFQLSQPEGVRIMKGISRVSTRCTPAFAALAVLAGLALASPVWAGTGIGELTVTNDGCGGDGYTCTHTPQKFNVLPGDTVHINISPGVSTGNCVGQPGNRHCTNTSASCISADSECTVGLALECCGDTTVIVKGQDNNPCTQDSDCTATGETGCNLTAQTCVSSKCSIDGNDCVDDSDCGQTGFCTFHDVIATSGRTGCGDIDVCYKVGDDHSMCSTAVVAYCGNVGLLANATVPRGTNTKSASGLRAVGAGTGTCQGQGGNGSACDDVTDLTCPATQNLCPSGGTCKYDALVCVAGNLEIPDCTNQVGSHCCGLTQGAYGAPNSIATATNRSCSSPDCSSTSLGFLPAATCQGCDAFAGDPNATTIGSHPTKSVTINDLCTLIDWLPAGGPSSQLSSGVGDNHYPVTPYPSGDLTASGSKGSGGGALSGQTMAGELNTFLSNCSPPFGGSSTFTPSDFGGFTLPADGVPLCTQRAGEDKILGTDDDVFQAFSFPSCVAGLTVNAVIACANQQLGTGSNSCGCTASDLTNALNNINVEFDECGTVVACPVAQVAGIYGGDPPHSGRCEPGDAEQVAVIRKLADETCATAPNHGAYVACVSNVARTNTSGLSPYLPKACRGKVVSCAAKSTIGGTGVTCCRTNSRGVTKCSVKSSAALCVPPSGGSACVGTHASCCDACTSSGCAP